jgi:hypothetical protein
MQESEDLPSTTSLVAPVYVFLEKVLSFLKLHLVLLQNGEQYSLL